MMRTTWSVLTALVLLVGASSCVIHDRDDWGRHRYDRNDRSDWDDRDRHDRDGDRDGRDCWREGNQWVCRGR